MRPNNYVEPRVANTLPAKSAGFSLVELMVAVALSSFLLLGVVEIYVSNKHSNRLQNGFSQVQENGRMAVEMLSRDIRRADFWGCKPDAEDIEVNLDVDHPDYDPLLYGFGDGGVGGANNVSGAEIGEKSLVDGTDTLVLRGGKAQDIRVDSPYKPPSSAELKIEGGHGIEAGDVLLIIDCSAGNLFQVTEINEGVNLVHNEGEGYVPGNKEKKFQKTYEDDAQLLAPYVKTYFIANDANGRPSLFQSVDGDTDELIPGVENMQVTYGEDTDGDLAVEFWRDADAVVDMAQVLAIRVVFSIRSYDSVGSTDGDGRLRRDYTVTTNLRNRMI